MKIFALALVALLLVPAAHAATNTGEISYPPGLIALLPAWIQEAEAMAVAEDKGKPWWNEADGFLARAKEAQGQGRFRTALFHIETYRELLIANRLIDEAKAPANANQPKSYVLQRVAGEKDDADAAWLAYRAKLHGYEGQLHSLQTIEQTLYSADLALAGMLASTEFDSLAGEFPKQEGFPEGYVFALVHASYTPLLEVGWADAILADAVKQEGLPPRIDDEKWNNFTSASTAYGLEGASPSYLEALDLLARPARNNGEGILSVAFVLAEQRATRANSMQTIFGDARSRGLSVVTDAARGMNKQYNNTTLEASRNVGLVGLFTSDAFDRVQLTQKYLASDQADLGTVISAWSSLEHAAYATSTLAAVSPIAPLPDTSPTKGTPGASVLALLGVALVAAMLARRR